MTVFYFVRHGHTESTGQKLTGWLPGVHLSEEGMQQAQSAAERLSKVKLKAIYSSPIDRTMETARAIADRHRLRIFVRDGLGEVDYGRWTNRSIKALTRTKLWGVIQRWPSTARFPDGESIRGMQARALDEVELIADEHPRSAICIVSHADVIKVVMAHYLGAHLDLYPRIEISPGSLSVLALGEHGPRVLALNSR